MKPTKLCRAIAYALSATATTAAFAEEEQENKARTNEIQTIVVTASKRSENIQETPIAVQAMDSAAMKDQNIGNFDDFVRYMPNVSLGGRGPGQSDVFIRGMAIQPITVMLSGAQGTSPNVALYVDEQPVTAPGRNLDVYATDLERIEVLPGPQGTLFGASSQAGTIRYITRKPELNIFEVGMSTKISSTSSGGLNNAMEGHFNLPLEDDMALRVAFYNVQNSGYIDNVYGEFTLDPAINTNVAAAVAGLPADTTFTTTSNIDLVEKDFNDSYYSGFRLGYTYQINDDWKLLIQHAQQDLGADGVFDYDPEIGDLEVSRYFPDGLEDSFAQTSWTVSGRMDNLELIYAGAFLDREVEQSIDYTGYNNGGAFIPFYTCSYTSTDQPFRECLDPTKGFKGQQTHERYTHEFRVATDSAEDLRFIGGVFLDDFTIETQDDYIYVATPELGFVPNAPLSTANSINPNPRAPGVAFFNDITRTEEQIAVFGEMAYDFTENFSATLGLRWYEIESDFTGSSNFANTGVDGDSGRDYDLSGGHSDQPLVIDDIITKVNVSYKIDSDIMIYGTYSEGFRPGGFNRGGGIPSANPNFPDVEVTYGTDDVTNFEFGWKAMLLDNDLRFNANIYRIDWSNMQVSRFDPVNVSILTFIENAADSEITGFEGDIIYRATEQLSIYSAFSYNDTELTATNAEVIELAPVGSTLPLTPEFQGNIRLRYDYQVDEYYMNWQFGVQYAGESYSSIVASQRQLQDSYSLMNLSYGIEKGNWSARFFVDNLSDERAELFINDQDDIPRITTNRPRTIGVSLSYLYY
ncbi:MAG: TonB-dependent receptor [Enterobacterales bacterium]|nr:TonB-dependent receptor [Enterobacterales bacterium]